MSIVADGIITVPSYAAGIYHPYHIEDISSVLERTDIIEKRHSHKRMAFFMWMGYKKDIFAFCNKVSNSNGIAVDIINSAGIAYHQHEVLYIIKPQMDAR